MKIFESIINRGDLVFDVGLNVGSKSSIFLDLGAIVIGFEPQVDCFNYALNKLHTNINFRAENIALGSKKGLETIYIASYHTISSMSLNFINKVKKERFIGYNWDRKNIVNVDTLDNMIIKYGIPKFIKIDVEGYELNVLKGLHSSIEIISIEFNPELSQQSFDCLNYINSLNDGNTVFNYGYREDDHFKFDNWLDKKDIFNYLKSVNDFKFEFGDIYCKKV